VRSRALRPRKPTYSTVMPNFFIAWTICSLSDCLTRGSLAPWPISSGARMPFGEEQWRARFQEFLLGRGVASTMLEQTHHWRPVGRGVVKQRNKVARSHEVDAGLGCRTARFGISIMLSCHSFGFSRNGCQRQFRNCSAPGPRRR
jgi:hypothetical protein